MNYKCGCLMCSDIVFCNVYKGEIEIISNPERYGKKADNFVDLKQAVSNL
jgi:hypothetical protein